MNQIPSSTNRNRSEAVEGRQSTDVNVQSIYVHFQKNKRNKDNKSNGIKPEFVLFEVEAL